MPRKNPVTKLLALGFTGFVSLASLTTAQEQIFLRSSTGSGTNAPAEFYEKLALGVSTNGQDWQWLYTRPTLTNFSRDASIIRRGGEFVVVYTDAFNSSNGTFGLARSTNLIHWTATNIVLTGPAMTNAPNNTWAPEWFVEDGRYYVLVRSSQTQGDNYGPPGIGYMECLDPGTWADWSAFTVLPGPQSNENDPFLLKVGSTYHLFTDDGGFGNTGDLLHRTSTNGPFAGYGAPSVISTNFRQAAALTNSTAWWQATPFEGPFVLPLGGSSYRLYFQATWWDNSFSIESHDGMQTWDIDAMRGLTYDGHPAYGHGSVMTLHAAEALIPMAAMARRADEAVAQAQDILENPNAHNLYTADQWATNRTAGRADVVSSPGSYGLYTSNSIMDLNLGGIMLRKEGTNAHVSIQLQISSDLSSGFTDHGEPLELPPVSLPGDKSFLRIRALGSQ